MEKEHIYKFLFRLGMILLISSVVIFLIIFSHSIKEDFESLIYVIYLGIYIVIPIPMFIISIILIIISKLKLKKIKNKNQNEGDKQCMI